ncbi:Cyclic nucleotide-gated olfactory channel [Bienertia sinuspersici]
MTSSAQKLKQEMVVLEVEIEEEEADEDLEDDSPAYTSNITTQICLKAMHPSEKMDRDVILRRIGHHKRMIKVKRAVDTFFNPPYDHVEPSQGWVNNAFSMP